MVAPGGNGGEGRGQFLHCPGTRFLVQAMSPPQLSQTRFGIHRDAHDVVRCIGGVVALGYLQQVVVWSIPRALG